MTITNKQSGTNVHEVADEIYRISTPITIPGSGFSFNQYLIVDDEPLIFHTGPRKMFPLVHEAVASVLPPRRLRHIAFSHVEADECGSLNEWLSAAPQSAPLCGIIAALVSVNDLADRLPRALADGESLCLGRHTVRWFDTPHLPHAWECGFVMEERTRTLLCGDLFTQGGAGNPPITESDILGPSEVFRHEMDYFSHTKERAPDAGKIGVDWTNNAGVHARQCMARRRRKAPARACRRDMCMNDGQQRVTVGSLALECQLSRVPELPLRVAQRQSLTGQVQIALGEARKRGN